MTIANSIVTNYDTLTDADFSRGIVVGYVYLSLPTSKLGPPSPIMPGKDSAGSDQAGVAPEAVGGGISYPVLPGYYAVKITSDATGKTGQGTLVDANGKVVAELPASITPPTAATLLKKLTITIGGGELCIDWHGSKKTIKICGSIEDNNL